MKNGTCKPNLAQKKDMAAKTYTSFHVQIVSIGCGYFIRGTLHGETTIEQQMNIHK